MLPSPQSGLTPNIIEQIKYLTACLKKLGQVYDLNEANYTNSKFSQVLDYLISIVKRSEIDIGFKKYVSNLKTLT